jgi:hypothetical protein
LRLPGPPAEPSVRDVCENGRTSLTSSIRPYVAPLTAG